MRVVVIVLAVLVILAVLYFFGVGRSGVQTCIQACEKSHCVQLSEGPPNCTKNPEAYDGCVDACRKEHREKD